MPRILAVADEIDPTLTFEALRALAPDLVVSCGDLVYVPTVEAIHREGLRELWPRATDADLSGSRTRDHGGP